MRKLDIETGRYFNENDFLENHHAVMLQKIVFVEVASGFDIELAHLSVGQLHAARVHGDDARADLVAEVAIDLGTDGAHQRNLIANRLDVGVLVFDLLAGTLASGLQAGLPGPQDNHVVAHVHEGVDDAAAKALSVGAQEDHRSQSPDDAQHGQHRAQAIAV